MRATLILIAACGLLVSLGCSPDRPTPDAAGDTPAPEPAPEAAPEPAPKAKPATEAPQPSAKSPEPAKGYLETVIDKRTQVKYQAILLGIQHSIQAHNAINGSNPKSLDELKQAGYAFPPPPKGTQYKYDPKTGEVDIVKK